MKPLAKVFVITIMFAIVAIFSAPFIEHIPPRKGSLFDWVVGL